MKTATDIWFEICNTKGSDPVEIIRQAMQDQHAKTWAMAKEKHINAIDAALETLVSPLFRPVSIQAQQAIASTPCPPLEMGE